MKPIETLSRNLILLIGMVLIPGPSFSLQQHKDKAEPPKNAPQKAPVKPAPKTKEEKTSTAPPLPPTNKSTEPENPPPAPVKIVPGAPAPEGVRYTSLVIDCTGLGVNSTPSPKLKAEDGTEVYGTISVPDDYLLETGIVAYPKTLEDAVVHSRIGGRPMIVKALSVDSATHCDPVISLNEAKRIQAGNEKSHFLERCAVVFLVAEK